MSDLNRRDALIATGLAVGGSLRAARPVGHLATGRQGREDGLDGGNNRLFAADHQTEAVLESEHTAAGAPAL